MSALNDLRSRVLLTWAVEYVEREVQTMEYSFGTAEDPLALTDEDVSIELADARRWLAEAKAHLASTPTSGEQQ